MKKNACYASPRYYCLVSYAIDQKISCDFYKEGNAGNCYYADENDGNIPFSSCTNIEAMSIALKKKAEFVKNEAKLFVDKIHVSRQREDDTLRKLRGRVQKGRSNRKEV